MNELSVSMNVDLLPLDDLIKTSDIDLSEWNYDFFLGKIINKRYKIFLSLIEQKPVQNLLDIGYGSGIFFPELKKYGSNLFGIDIHNKNFDVMKKLTKHGITAELIQGDAAKLPFEDNYFQLCTAVSSIEFIDNIDDACKEVTRVLTDDGKFIVITPNESPLTDLGLKILTGRNAKKDYNEKRKNVIPTILKYFRVEKEITFPKVPSVKFYTGFRLAKK